MSSRSLGITYTRLEWKPIPSRRSRDIGTLFTCLCLLLFVSTTRGFTIRASRNSIHSRRDVYTSRTYTYTYPKHPLPQLYASTPDDLQPSETADSAAALTPFQEWYTKNIFLSITPTPEIIAIMTIYFVQGAIALTALARTYLLKDELQLGPAEMSALSGVFVLPWTIKPLYGFLSDGVPLFGYRRRSYLVLAGVSGCLAYLALGSGFGGLLADMDPQIYVGSTIAALLLGSATIAVSDVVADGICVQQTRDAGDLATAGGLQSLCWGSAAIGGLLASYFSGSLLEVVSPRTLFGYTAVLPLLVAAIAILIDEQPIDASPENKIDIPKQVTGLWGALRTPAVWKPALFLFLWQSTPTGEGAFLYFMTNDLGFGPEFLGRVTLVSACARLVGVWVYQKYLRTVPIKKILFWSAIVSVPLGLSQLLLITHVNRSLGIPDGAFVFGDDIALSITGQLAFLPTLVLAAKICPPGVEAVLFATLMSIFNGAGVTGSEIGALLTKMLGITESNFDNLGLLTIICNLSSLYPLLLLNTLLDGVGDLKDDDGNDNDDTNGDLLLNGGVENAMIFEANGADMGVLSSDDVADETVLDIPFFCTVIEETP